MKSVLKEMVVVGVIDQDTRGANALVLPIGIRKRPAATQIIILFVNALSSFVLQGEYVIVGTPYESSNGIVCVYSTRNRTVHFR